MEESGLCVQDGMDGKSSLDIVSLNNMVVNLRPTTKKSRIQVIQRLNKTIKSLQEKSGNQNDNRSKRATKLLEEVKILKTSGVDEITKFCLSQSGLEQNNSKLDKEQAAMSRVAKHKAISEKIQSLKKEHQDWDSLVFYIKNHIPRRVKKKATKKRNKLHAKSKPDEPSAETIPSTKTAPAATVAETTRQPPITTDETVAKLRNFGGVVQAFGAEDDCEAGQLHVEVSGSGEDHLEKTQNKSSKKRFFEGCSDGDDTDADSDDDGIDNVGIKANYEHAVKSTKKYSFKKKHVSEAKKPFTRNLKHQEKQRDKQPSGTRQNKQNRNKPMENLHPSWEAKRKEKEMLKSIPSERTKIVFDD